MKVLVLDIGGSHVKLMATEGAKRGKIDSGPDLTPADLIAAVRRRTSDWEYDAVSIGFPAPVKDNRPVLEPRNLGPGWREFDFAAAFGRPVRVVNDALLQAIGGYRGGRMLFLGLGTGLGSALVLDGLAHPLELAHLPYRKGRTFEQCVGAKALGRVGKRMAPPGGGRRRASPGGAAGGRGADRRRQRPPPQGDPRRRPRRRQHRRLHRGTATVGGRRSTGVTRSPDAGPEVACPLCANPRLEARSWSANVTAATAIAWRQPMRSGVSVRGTSRSKGGARGRRSPVRPVLRGVETARSNPIFDRDGGHPRQRHDG